MQQNFLDQEIRKLQKRCDVKKGDLLQMFELVTYLAATKEISLDDAERYTYILFKMLEEARAS